MHIYVARRKVLGEVFVSNWDLSGRIWRLIGSRRGKGRIVAKQAAVFITSWEDFSTLPKKGLNLLK